MNISTLTDRERVLVDALDEVLMWANTERRWAQTGDDLETWINRCDRIEAALAKAGIQ